MTADADRDRVRVGGKRAGGTGTAARAWWGGAIRGHADTVSELSPIVWSHR
jgi:hypothetical protein